MKFYYIIVSPLVSRPWFRGTWRHEYVREGTTSIKHIVEKFISIGFLAQTKNNISIYTLLIHTNSPKYLLIQSILLSGVSDLRRRPGLRHQWLEREHGHNRVGLLFQQIAFVCSYSRPAVFFPLSHTSYCWRRPRLVLLRCDTPDSRIDWINRYLGHFSVDS